MGKKIKKSELLDGIQASMKACLEYQKKDPDLSAKNRVESLKNDPVPNRKYYVNITLKNAQEFKSTKLEDRKKKAKNNLFLMSLKKMDEIFEAGCIIEVEINTQKKNVTEETIKNCTIKQEQSYSSLMKALTNSYFNDAYALLPLHPSSSRIPIENDIQSALIAGKKKIIYAVARFSLVKLKEELKKFFNEDLYDLYEFILNEMEKVTYVDMGRKTSLEQNVNEFFKTVSSNDALNGVTMFNDKNVYNLKLKDDHAIFDLCQFLISKMDKVRIEDSIIADRKMKLFSETLDQTFYDIDEAKYEQYKNLGGQESWPDWGTVQTQLLTFKSIVSTGSKALSSIYSDKAFMKNLYAAEMTTSIYQNSDPISIKSYWKKDTDKLKTQPVGDIFIVNEDLCDAAAVAEARSFVTENFVDPPMFEVNPYGSSNVKFSSSMTYSFKIPASTGKSMSDYTNINKAHRMLSKKDLAYETIDGYFKPNNKIKIYRDTTKIDGNSYDYIPNKIELKKGVDAPCVDELEDKKDLYEIPKESYYCAATRSFFDANKLSDRLVQCMISYQTIPKYISMSKSFIQDSVFDNLIQAENRLKAVKEDYENKYQRCCIDTIDYDPWNMLKQKLEKLFMAWNSVYEIDDEIEIPPIEIEDLSKIKCSNCENTLDKCKCEECRLCNRCYPIDFYGIAKKHGLTNENDGTTKAIDGLFIAAGYIYDQANNAMSYTEIAREIYSELNEKAENSKSTDFATINDLSVSLLSIDFKTLKNSKAYQSAESVASKFSEYEWNKFKKEYSYGLKNGFKLDSMKYAKEHKVGVADGYAYIPTGYNIVFEYNFNDKEFIVRGASKKSMELLKQLVDADYDQYMVQYKTLAGLCEPLNEDIKKFIAYPAIPSVKSIYEEKEDVTKRPKEFSESYVYVPDEDDVKIITENKPVDLPVMNVKFQIYVKKPIVCRYPKNEDPECRSEESIGFCGLKELFEKPMIVFPYYFDLDYEINRKKLNRKHQEMKQAAISFKEMTNDAVKSACNVDKNIMKIDDLTSVARKNVIEFTSKYKNMFNTMSASLKNESNERSIIYEVMKRGSASSVMSDYASIFNKSIKSIEFIINDNFVRTKKDIASSIKLLPRVNSTIKRSLFDIASSFAASEMCNRIHKDHLTSLNTLKSIDDAIVQKIEQAYGDAFIKVIQERIESITAVKNVAKLKLDDSESEKLIEAMKGNDFELTKEILIRNKIIDDDEKSDEAAVKKIKELLTATNDAQSILNASSKEILKNLAPDACVKTPIAKFTNPQILLKAVSVKSQIADACTKMTPCIAKGVSESVDEEIESKVCYMIGVSLPTDGSDTGSGPIDTAKIKAAKEAIVKVK